MVPCIADHRAVFGVELADLRRRRIIAIGTSGPIRRTGPRGRSATISSASRFSGSMTRTSHEVCIADHRAVFGVEPICAVLPIAPSTYHRHRHQRTHPTHRSARAQRDDQLRVEIQRVYDAHQVYGPRKVWKQLRRDGIRVAHRGARDARDGPRRGRSGPGLDHHDPRR